MLGELEKSKRGMGRIEGILSRGREQEISKSSHPFPSEI